MSSKVPLDDLLKKVDADVWVTDNESRDVVMKYPEGVLTYTLKTVKYSDGNSGTTMNLRFARARDQKTYVESYGHARFEQDWGANVHPEVVRGLFKNPEYVMQLDRNCVIILRRERISAFSNRNIQIILTEEVDSRSEEAKVIDRLAKENAALKTKHAAELEAIRAEVVKLRAEAAAWNDVRRPTKKSKPADVDAPPPDYQ